MTLAATPARAQRRARRSAARSPSGSLSRATTSCITPGGGAKAPRLPAESAAAAMVPGSAATMERTVSIPSPTSSVSAAGSPKRTARPCTRPSAFRGRATSALAGREGSSQVRWTPEMAPWAPGDGGDQRRQAVHAAAVAEEQRGVEAERRETAAVDRPGAQIGLGMGAVDGAAALPQAARRLRAVVGVCGMGDGRGRQREEGARLREGDAERAGAGGDADEVEQVAVLPGARVGPLSGRAGRGQADEEGAPPGAANVAGGPVAAVLAAVGEIAPADLLGAGAEGGGDGGGVHGARPARMTAPAKPGRRIMLDSMGHLARCFRGNARSRPLSGSLRRRDGGRCAKREPCRAGVAVTGRATARVR